MTEVTLSCFSGFSCIAGACPDTCCAGWEVDLDDSVLPLYRSLPGPLGQELRDAIQQEDGYTFFAMRDGRCPFLNEKKLCRLILALGDDALSVTCREHPRFWEEYGSRRETCLSISCPEAARLLLTEPLRLETRETDDAAEPDPELNQALLEELLFCRKALLELARSPLPLNTKLAFCLDAAQSGMALPEDPAALSDFWLSQPTPPLSLDIPGFLSAMEGMEFTRPQLQELLPKALAAWSNDILDAPALRDSCGRLLFYFLYRYLLRGVWSGLVAEKLRLAVYSTAAIAALSQAAEGDTPQQRLLSAAVIFSREVEHSPENLELLYELLCSLP